LDFGLEAAPDDLHGHLAPTETGELELLSPLPKRGLHPLGDPIGGDFDAQHPLGWAELFNSDFHGFSHGVK